MRFRTLVSSAFLLSACLPSRTVAEFRRAIREVAHVAGMWKIFLAQADHDLTAEVILPRSYKANRGERDWSIGNRDHSVVFGAGQRILRGALANLVTGEPRYRDAAWAQVDVRRRHGTRLALAHD